MTQETLTELTIAFTLEEADLEYFRNRLEGSVNEEALKNEAKIIDGALKLVAEALAAKPPHFVQDSLNKLEPLIAMLRDDQWRLEGEDRQRVLAALSYFAEPDDMIPDRIPGIGFLDDAIMIELVAEGLAAEIEAYKDFVVKKALPSSDLEAEREALQTRMRRRRRYRVSGRNPSPKGMRSPFSVF